MYEGLLAWIGLGAMQPRDIVNFRYMLNNYSTIASHLHTSIQLQFPSTDPSSNPLMIPATVNAAPHGTTLFFLCLSQILNTQCLAFDFLPPYIMDLSLMQIPES